MNDGVFEVTAHERVGDWERESFFGVWRERERGGGGG